MGLFGGGKPAPVTEAGVLDALRAIVDPNAGRDIVSLGFVKEVAVRGGEVSFTLELTSQHPPLLKAELHSRAKRAVAALPGVAEVKAGLASRREGPRPGAGPGGIR